jgi:hypothetical protein
MILIVAAIALLGTAAAAGYRQTAVPSWHQQQPVLYLGLGNPGLSQDEFNNRWVFDKTPISQQKPE